MFDARLLSVFREVATRGSFSDAATALSFTQPAISSRSPASSASSRRALLVRDARGVTLTPAGEVLLRHAETVLAQLRRPRPRSRPSPASSARACASGAFPSAAASIMPPALAELRAAHPRRTSRCASSRTPPALDALRARRARRRDGARLRAQPDRAAGRHRGRRPCSTTRCSSRCPTAPARGPQRHLPRRPARRRVDGVRRGRDLHRLQRGPAGLRHAPASSPASPSSPRTTARSWGWSRRAWAWR